MINYSEKIMNSDSNIDLESFVQNFFISQGAVVEKSGSCLDVLAPQALAERIGIPNFCRLDIGNEKGGDHEVNYGSPLLEKMADAACDKVPFTRVRLIFHYLKTQGFDRLIEEMFTFQNAVVKLERSAEVQTDYLLLTCRYLAQSDEQKEGLIPLACHLETGAPVDQISPLLALVEKQYDTGELFNALEPESVDKLIQWVQTRASRTIENQIGEFRDSMNRRYQRDVANLSDYYTELSQEMTEALNRSGISTELSRERREKIDLIPVEMAKKKEDLFKKYSIKVTLDLSGVMLIRTPAVKLFCKAAIGRRQKSLSLIYNPITKSLDPLVCPQCGEGTFNIQFNHQLHLRCPQCA